MHSPMFLCDRDKRDIHFSDEPTDEDLNLFVQTPPSPRKRHKREAGRISKENATYYCEEKISKTKIGKLCAKIGINVQALVNACSFDVEVNCVRLMAGYLGTLLCSSISCSDQNGLLPSPFNRGLLDDLCT